MSSDETTDDAGAVEPSRSDHATPRVSRVRKFFTPLIALLAYFVIRLLQVTLRVRVQGALPDPDGDAPCIYAFWHGEQQLILAALQHRPRPLAVMTSRSADGELQTRILRRFGLETVRGSSSRGGAAALRALIRRVRAGLGAAIAVDGPRGPRHVAKGGVVQLARLTGAPIVLLRGRVSRAWRLKSAWDRYVIPKPFAQVDVTVVGELSVERRDADVEGITARLTRQMGGDGVDEASAETADDQHCDAADRAPGVKET